MFVWGVVVSSVFSLGSAFAPSAPVLLALRALHGIGLALGSATSVALVSLAYPAEVRGRALGICTAAIGPVGQECSKYVKSHDLAGGACSSLSAAWRSSTWRSPCGSSGTWSGGRRGRAASTT